MQVSSNAFGSGLRPDPLFPEDPSLSAPTEVVYDWDLASDEIIWSPSYALVPGFPSLDLVASGLGFAEHLAAESPSSRYEAIMAPGGCDAGGGVVFKAVYGLVEHKRAQSSPVWVEDTGRWFADAGDRPSRVHGIIRVITERFEAERRQSASAQRDAATGVFNRTFFVEHLARQLSLAARKSSTFAVLLIGLDLAGSSEPIAEAQVVEAVARMRLQMRSHEVIARHAGAKFAVLLEACNETQAAAAADRLVAAIIAAEPGAPYLSPRVGAVIAPAHGRTPQALLQFAEEALEAARQPSGPGYVRYETKPEPQQPSPECPQLRRDPARPERGACRLGAAADRRRPHEEGRLLRGIGAHRAARCTADDARLARRQRGKGRARLADRPPRYRARLHVDDGRPQAASFDQRFAIEHC